MTIYVDVMGGDHAPLETIKGAYLAAQEFGVALTLVGKVDVISDIVKQEKLSSDKISLLNAEEIVTMDEEPAAAVRKKKESSVVVSALKVKEDSGSVFVSAGSTGAVLSAALLYTGRIKGVQRPALCTLLPGKMPVLLIDNGANAECKPEYLLQFAVMGSAYMQAVLGIERPRVALVNIGAEEIKGTPLYKETHQLLKDANVNFVGNLEPKELLDGVADVVVCDGFTGNIILKTLEGSFHYTFGLLKKIFMKNGTTKLAAAILKKDLYGIKKKMDPSTTGGVPLLGINGGVIKAHGSSDAVAFKNAIGQAIQFQQNNVVGKITKML